MSDHIISLKSSNVKRLTAVAIKLDENARTVIISGENGAGKSSVLDSIEFCLRGKSIQEKPIRAGKETARIVLETETMVVTRTFSAESGENYLKFENKEGFRADSPQKLLDKMIEQIGFDPLQFSTMDADEQGKKLLSLFPTPIDLAENASFRKAAFEDRTDINREIKQLTALIGPGLPHNVPPQEVSIAALSEKASALRQESNHIHGMANKVNNLNSDITRNSDQERSLREQLATKLKAKQEQIASLQSQMVTLEEDCALQIESIQKARSDMQNQRDELKNSEVRPLEIIQQEQNALDVTIKNAEETNAKVRLNQENDRRRQKLEEATKRAADLTDKIKKVDDARADALRAAKFPVDGLSIDDNGHVMLNSVPFKQASMAQKLIVGIALAASSKSKLRVCLIRDASLLDAKSMKIVEQMASEKDLQIWMERVEDTSPCAIQIVDGSNIGAKDAPEVEEPGNGAEAQKTQTSVGALFGEPPAAVKKKGKKVENPDPFKA